MLPVSAAQARCATAVAAPLVASTSPQDTISADAAAAGADHVRAGWRTADFGSATCALADALHAAIGQLARMAEGVAYANHRATMAERMAVADALQALAAAAAQARADGPLAAHCAAAAAIPWSKLNSKRQQVCHARKWHARLVAFAGALPQGIAREPEAAWVKPRPDTFARIVAGFAHLRQRADLQAAVQAVLAERRLKLFPEFASAWLAVLRPDVYPQWPGLARFLPAMLAAHTRDPRVLQDHAAYSEALMQAAAPDVAGPSLLDFLVRFGKPVLHLLVCLATGRPIDRNTTRMVLGSDAIRQMRPLTELIEAHAPLIRQCVQHSYSRGFPVRWSEIHLVLARRGVRLSSPQIAFIPEVLDDIERCGTWFFPLGEAPAQLHRFPLGYRVVRWYFGSPPDDLAQLPAEPGCCEKLLAQWPTGFSRADVLATLALRQPGLAGRARQHVVHDWIRQRLIVCMGGGLWMVNPDFLCRAASLEVLARCPPRDTWPDSLLADDADLQDALREAADEAAPDSPDCPDDPDGQAGDSNDWPHHAWPARAFSRGVGGWRSVDESIANACQDDTLQLPRARPDGPALLAVLRPALDEWGAARGLAWLPVDLAPEPWRVMEGGGFDGLLVRAVIASELTGRALARSANKRFYARIHEEGGPDMELFDGEVRPRGVTDFGHGQAGFHALVAVPADGGPARLQALLDCACLPGVAAWCLAAPGRPGTAGECLRHLVACLQEAGGTRHADRLARLLAQAPPLPAACASTPDPSCPAPPPALSARPTEVRVSVSQRARDAALIFEVVGELHAAGTLQEHLLTDTAGHRTLSVKSLTRAVVQRHPGVYAGAVSDVLIGLTPDNVGPLLARRQWLQPRVTFAQMEAAVADLGRDFPLYFCLARSEIAQRINQRLPHSFCEAATFTSYTRSAPRDRRAAERQLDECIADGRIYWFCLGPRNRHLDHPALLDYLAQQGIGLSHKALQAMWLRKSRGIAWDEQVFVHPALASSPRARQHTARRLMEHLGLAVGQPMPNWDDFLRGFETLFCAAPPGGVPCRYPAHMAVGIHRALERVLAGEVAPPAGLSTPRRVGRRPSPTVPGGTRKRPVQSEPGELPAAKRRALVPFVAPFRTWVRQDDAVDGLHDLYRALNNLAQDPTFLRLRADEANRRVDIDDAMRLPSLPGGSGWAPLRLSPRHFRALAPVLVACLDAALLYRDNTLRPAARRGRFAAVRRHGGRLFLLDGRSAGAEQVTAADAVRQIGAACGGFWAALPRSVCEGVVGQCVTYHGLPGFLDGCDAVQAVAGGALPIAGFAGWLDGHLSLRDGQGHEALDARRRAAYPGIDLGHVAGFLRHLGHGARWRPLRGLPVLMAADAGEAFVLEVEREVYSHAQGTWLLLKMPTAPHIVALALEEGDICARAGGARVPWRALVAQALRVGRTDGAGLFVPFTA